MHPNGFVHNVARYCQKHEILMAKVQHYLSQMYLRGFSPWRYDQTANDRQKNQVWVYFLKKKEILLTSVHNVAARSHYYSFKDHDGSYNHSVEKLFSKIEDRTAETFRSVETAINGFNLYGYTKGIGETDRLNLMQFLFLHMIRVPAVMDYLRQESAKHEASISKEHGKDYSENYVQKNILRVLIRIGRNKDAPILDYLLKKDCRILSVLRSRACFLTTDNPVRRFNKTEPDGIFYPNTGVYLPLNQRALLFLHGNEAGLQTERFRDLTAIFDLNCYLARRAKELIVCSNKEYLTRVLDTISLEVINASTDESDGRDSP
jgi:hypothetical protein